MSRKTPKSYRYLFSIVSLLIAVFVNTAIAQEVDNSARYHPFLTDKFHLGIGGFWPTKSVDIRVDGSVPGEEIDLDEDLGYDESDSTTSVNFRWRYSKSWSFWGQYWSVDSQGSGLLKEDIEWEDVIFKEGTLANSELDFSVLRLFLGRAFKLGANQEFGVGAGIHAIKLDGYIEGQIITGMTTTFHRETVKTTIPLPNIGGWYMYSWSPKWIVEARVDWLSASIGDYSGGLFHAQGGINYQFSKTFGIGLSYSNFTLDLDVDSNDWHGSVETRQNGPRLELTASW